MATYVYRCVECGRQQEVQHGMDEAPVYWCVDCSHSRPVYLVRVFTAPHIRVEGGTRRAV